MKHNTFFCALTILLLASTAVADDLSATFWASRAALIAHQITRTEKVTHLPLLVKRDREILASEAKKKNFELEIPKVLQKNEVLELQFMSRKVTLDFKDFAERKIFMNKKSIALSGRKTFYNYRSEIQALLAQKESSALSGLLRTPAYASDSESITNYLTSLVTSAAGYTPKELSGQTVATEALATVLIGAYRNEAQKWYEFNANDIYDEVEDYFETLIFSCTKTGQLERITQVVIMDGEQKKFTELVSVAGGQWQRQRKGRVLSTLSAEQVFGDQAKLQAPYYQFPKIARRCCEQKACAQQVATEVRSLLENEGPANKKTQAVQ